MKQPDFFYVEERLARLVISSKRFPGQWILKDFVLTSIKLWPVQTAVKADVLGLIRF